MLEATEHELEDFATDDLDAFIAYHHGFIRNLARKEGRRRGFTTPDDIEQAVMEEVITRWHALQGKGVAHARAFFNKSAGRFIRSESDDYMYFSGSYIYKPAEVRRRLRDSAWVEGEDCPDVDAKVDLNAAFKEVAKGRQQALYRHYCLGIPVEDMSQAEKRSVYRGVDDITNWLNRKEGVRSVSLDELRAKLSPMLPPVNLSGRQVGV